VQNKPENENEENTNTEQGRTLINDNLRSSQSSLCRNCHRQIPGASIVMHESMCVRMNVLCPKCNAVVKKGEMEIHDKQNHSLVECACGVMVEQIQLKEHKLTLCELRKVSCPYCQYSILAKEMDEHMIHCGTRTAPCDYCKKLFKLAEMQLHLSKCKFNPNAEINNQQFHCPQCEINLKQILMEQSTEQLLPNYTAESFISHIKSEHSNDPPLKLMCPICSSKQPSAPIANLYQHVLLHEIRILKEQQWRNKKLTERFE